MPILRIISIHVFKQALITLPLIKAGHVLIVSSLEKRHKVGGNRRQSARIAVQRLYMKLVLFKHGHL